MQGNDIKIKSANSLTINSNELCLNKLQAELAVYKFLLNNRDKQIILHPTKSDPEVLRKSFEFKTAQELSTTDFVYIFCLDGGETSLVPIYSTGEQVFFSHSLALLLQLIPNAIVYATNETYQSFANSSYKLLLYSYKTGNFNDIDSAAINNPNSIIISSSSADTLTIKNKRNYFITESYFESYRINAIKLKAIIEFYFNSYVSGKLNAVQEEIVDFYRSENTSEVNYYELAYKDAEKYYWYSVLKWIDQLDNISSAIDIGAAYGTLLLYALKTFNIKRSVIIDPVGYLSKTYINKYQIEYLNLDFERDKIEDLGKFDLLLFTEVLEHLNYHPSTTLNKLRALLNSNGYLILSTPDAQEWGITKKYYNSLSSIPVFNGQNEPWQDDHIWQYSFSEMIEILTAADFEIIDIGYSKGGIARHFCFLLQLKPETKNTPSHES